MEAPLECRQILPEISPLSKKEAIRMVPRFFVPRKIRGFSIFLERIDKMNLKEKQPKIYIICGKARHGKDTINEIIRNYNIEKKNDDFNLQ